VAAGVVIEQGGDTERIRCGLGSVYRYYYGDPPHGDTRDINPYRTNVENRVSS